jgi:protein Hikeshi
MAAPPPGGPQPLFGLVPAGRPVVVSPIETPTPTSFLYAIPALPPGAKPFSHIVVFLLPGVVLPPNTAAAIYLVTPAPNQPQPNFKFLGGIGPGKESAIFKLGPGAAAGNENVVLGISVEPAEAVAARMTEQAPAAAGSGALVPAGGAAAQQQPSTQVLAQRIIKNAFNFLASFSGTAGEVEVVPLKAFEEWWKKFESKVRADPSFLERED